VTLEAIAHVFGLTPSAFLEGVTRSRCNCLRAEIIAAQITAAPA
jgi:hypothetical protein